MASNERDGVLCNECGKEVMVYISEPDGKQVLCLECWMKNKGKSIE